MNLEHHNLDSCQRFTAPQAEAVTANSRFIAAPIPTGIVAAPPETVGAVFFYPVMFYGMD